MTIARVRILVCHSATLCARRARDIGGRMRALAHEFPSVAAELEWNPGSTIPTFELARWNDQRIDFRAFDDGAEELARLGEATLVIRGEADEGMRGAWEMLTRWQRLVDRRNAASRTHAFNSLLERLRSHHDLDKPLVRADWNHALDTWQWLLRLDGEAGLPVQLAALLHDVERLESEADARVEHLAPDYAAFKKTHAERGARIAAALLAASGIEAGARDRASALIAGHERPGADPDLLLVNDADALSFFSQNSAGYLDYFGPEQTRRKVAYTLGRMRPAARARLATVRLRADISRFLDEHGGGTPRPPDGHASLPPEGCP
jgi:hypothetical protein